MKKNLKSKYRSLQLHKLQQYFLNPSPKGNKSEINKWDLIKLKSFCTAKEICNKMKRQPSWGKMFANDMPNKGLISNIYKKLIQLNIKKKKTNHMTKK